jgi:glycerophosphoryl diester phosphodiesterase
MQQDGIQYTNFISPGCTSESAHISFLQWLFPVDYGNTFDSQGWYQVFSGYIDPLPVFLNNNGYSTTFLSSVSLKFLNQYSFLQRMWFGTIIGDEVFRGIKDYTFLAAPDESLYENTIRLVKTKEHNNQPYFINIQTISTHTPWNTPYGRTQKAARRYADDSLSHFYQQLRQEGFFDNGILVIFGDHRVPGNPSQQEIEYLWGRWPAQVLATIIGTGIGSWTQNHTLIQPIDLYFSLKNLVNTWYAPSRKYYNDVFDYSIRRDWWVNYCKFKSNDILYVQHTWAFVVLDDTVNSIAYDFITSFRSYQFQNILSPSFSVLSWSFSWFKAPGNMIVLSHGWANSSPMNTLSGFLTSIYQWWHGIEIDLSFTADNVNVVRHGPYPINFTTWLDNVSAEEYKHYTSLGCFGAKTIADSNYNDIRKQCKLQNGESILTFDELLLFTKDIVPLYFVELKIYDTTKAEYQMEDAIAIAKKHNLTDKIVFMTYDPVIRKLLTQQSWIRVARDMFDWDEYPTEQEAKKIEYLMTPFTSLTGKHLNKLLSYHIPFFTYTPISDKDIESIFFMRDYLNIPISWVLVDDIPKLLKIAH